MATHSSVLAWRIPGTGEPGGLPSMGSHRVRHNWRDLVAAAAASRLSQRSTLGWKSLWSPRQFWGSWTAMSKRIMVNSYLPTREKINSKCITNLNIKANGIQHSKKKPRSTSLWLWFVGRCILNLSKLQEIVEARQAWRAVVHRVTKSWTQLKDWIKLNYFWKWMA